MRTSENIRASRIRAGKSAQQVAASLGLNEAWYRDLEQYDDEFASTLTVFQASQLATLLGVQLQDLVTETEPASGKAALLDLPSIVKKHIEYEGISIEQFEDLVGWELQEFLRSPVKMAAELPIMFLQDVTSPLGINWMSLISQLDEH